MKIVIEPQQEGTLFRHLAEGEVFSTNPEGKLFLKCGTPTGARVNAVGLASGAVYSFEPETRVTHHPDAALHYQVVLKETK